MSGPQRQSIYMGLGPQPLAGPGSGSAGSVAFPFEIYETPPLDLTKTYANIELVPAKFGHVPIQLSRFWIILSRSGTQVTPPTYKAGSDPTHTNFNPIDSANPTNVNVNGANPVSLATGVAGATTALIAGLPVFFDLTSPSAGTGGYACMAKFMTMIWWVSLGG